jgi:hypothetical protein
MAAVSLTVSTVKPKKKRNWQKTNKKKKRISEGREKMK